MEFRVTMIDFRATSMNFRMTRMRQLITGGILCYAVVLAGCDSSNLDTLESRLLVADNNITSVEVTSPSSVIQVGGSRALMLIGTIGGVQDAVTVVTESASWSSSDSSIISVDSDGVVTGIADGSATITSTIDPLSSSIELTASSALLQAITIEADSTVSAQNTIDECTSVSFTASGDFGDGDEARPLTDLVSWSLSAGNIGSIDSDGVLRSNGAGLGIISAQLDGIMDTFTLTVADNLGSIKITSDGTTLSARNSVQYSATASFIDNTSTVDITDNATWTLDAFFASVSNTLPDNGLVTATSTGTDTLSVTCGGVTESLSISSGSDTEIIELFFDRVSPFQSTFAGEETISLSAFVRFENGTNQDVTEDSEWIIVENDNALNTVDNSDGSRGEVTIRGPGELVIEVSFEDEDNDPPQTFTSRFTVISEEP